jgi:hypothetical protein
VFSPAVSPGGEAMQELFSDGFQQPVPWSRRTQRLQGSCSLAACFVLEISGSCPACHERRVVSDVEVLEVDLIAFPWSAQALSKNC